MVEFVSANPTGPLHVGHGRQAALGDAIAYAARMAGLRRVRASSTTTTPASRSRTSQSPCARARRRSSASTGTFPEDGYRGEYIRELAQRYLDEVGRDLADIESIRRFAVAELRKEQDRDLQAFGVAFDNYYLESSLYTDGRVDDTVERLVGVGHDVRAAKARCGCARRTSATTRTASCASPTAATRTSCPTSRIT